MIIIKNNSPTEIPKQIGAKVWIDEGKGVGNFTKNSLDLIQDQKLAKLDICKQFAQRESFANKVR